MYQILHNFYGKKKNILIGIVFIFCDTIAVAQNVSSPYSIIGIGDIEQSYFNRTSGMANTGIAYRNNRFLILNNPAAISSLQSQLFLVEVEGRGIFSSYTGPGILTNITDKDFSVERLSVGMRLNKWWSGATGLMPFSTSNYAFSGTKKF